MSCGCGNTPKKTCNEPIPCSDPYTMCQATQIEQLIARTNQLKDQLECMNPGDDYPDLSAVRDCATGVPAGSSCCPSPTSGAAVGAPSCCGDDNKDDLTAYCTNQANSIRIIQQELLKLDKLVCEIRKQALKTVLLDNAGNAKGGLALNGDLKSFHNGSWELATS